MSAGAPLRFDVSADAARRTLISLLPALLLGPLSQNIVAPALPSLARSLGSSQNIHWVVTAYLAAGTALTPVFGRLSDTWGRRNSLMLALGVFLAGSVVCALAASLPVLVTGRVLQGAGGGALNALVLTILADIIPPAERGRYQGWTTGAFLLGAVAGPALGGLIAQHAHWTGVFWACLFLACASMAAALATLRNLPRFEKPEPMDLVGAALLILATTVTLLIFADTPLPRVLYLGMAVCAWPALAWRLSAVPHPLAPIKVLSSPLVVHATLAAALASAVVVVLTMFMPSFMQQHLGLSVSQGGLALAPMLAGSALGSLAAGQAMMRFRRYRKVGEWGLWAAIGAMAGLTISAIWLPNLVFTEVALTVAAAGIGAVIPITTFSIQNEMATHHLGAATAANNFVRQLTASLMTPAATAVLFFSASTSLSPSPELADHGRLFGALAGVLFIAWLCLIRMEERPLQGRG